jgi:putative tricarboxylic transport membrane protein
MLPRRFWHWLWPQNAAGFALAGLFALVLIMALGYPPEARLFPLIVSTAGLAFSVMLLVAQAAPGGTKDGGRDTSLPAGDGDGRRFGLALLSAPAFCLLVWLLGFYLAALLTLSLLPYALGYRHLVVTGLFAVVLVAVLYLVFSLAMEMSLPDGLLGSWVLDTLIYRR